MTDPTGDSNTRQPDFAHPAIHSQPDDAGLSLDELGAAFAQMLNSGDDPYATPPAPDAQHDAGDDNPLDVLADVDRTGEQEADDGCELSPKTILEAILFVGHPTNEPLTSVQVAGLMRGVRPSEVDDLVRDLNVHYHESGCPYEIVSHGAGYLLSLRDEFTSLRDKFQGRLRQARLSPAALEVLALIAYNQPLTSEDVTRLRGRTSGPILSQLVRRQLLRIERPQTTPRATRYFTTPRFLKLFGLESLDDLPRGQEFEPR